MMLSEGDRALVAHIKQRFGRGAIVDAGVENLRRYHEKCRAQNAVDAEALRAEAEAAIVERRRFRVDAFLRARGRRKSGNGARKAFRERFGMSPMEYYFNKLGERVRSIQAATPQLSRGWLGAKAGMSEAMLAKVLARLEAQAKREAA